MAAVTLLALGNGALDVTGERCRRDGERRGDERDSPDDERGDERASTAGDRRQGGDTGEGRRPAGRRGRGEGPAAGSRPLARPPPPLCSTDRALACRRPAVGASLRRPLTRCTCVPAAASLHSAPDTHRRPEPSVLGELVYSIPGAKNVLEMPLLAAQALSVVALHTVGCVRIWQQPLNCSRSTKGSEIVRVRVRVRESSAMGSCSVSPSTTACSTASASCSSSTRGVPLSVPPALDRALLRARDPPQVAFLHHEFTQIDDGDDGGSPAQNGAEPFLHRSFRFTPESIAHVKALVSVDGGGGGRAPTAFEALGMGHAWRSKLLFAVDGRPRQLANV
uniref:Uncharacterized protein n=1 Tax=Oryza meridionalis TaxID=40149 RepID=A0A0E0F7N2_9ORYZ